MNKDLTELVVVLDRSGSMSNCVNDTVGGLKTLVEEQKKLPGKVNFSLIQFDDQYEWVHKGVDIGEVKDIQLVPRGYTALLDAVGKAIAETGERLAKLPESDRPGLVSVVIATDGGENSSTEYTNQKVKDMITHQQDVYKWHFTFLGADFDGFGQAASIGIDANNVIRFAKGSSGKMYNMVSDKLSTSRGVMMAGGVVSAGAMSYSKEDRKEVS